VLEQLAAPGFLDRVSKAGQHIRDEIAGWGIKGVTNIRGKGLMIGFDFSSAPSSEVQKKCLDAGLCITTAGKNVIRFLPPLVITDAEVEKGLGILKPVLQSF
jgi:acetylornithine/N-succinyldiaminopimelate aminotransferase